MYKKFCYNSIVINKLVIEIIKAKEGLDPLYYIRGPLVTDYVYLFRVNLNSFYSYNKPKVFYMFYPKLVIGREISGYYVSPRH